MATEDRILTPEFLVLAASCTLFAASVGGSNALLPKFVVDELGGTEASAGAVMAMFAVSSMVMRLWFGRVGGRRGVRILVVWGCAIGAAGLAMLVVTASVPMAGLARLATGAAQAAMVTGATSLAVEAAPEQRRGEAVSYVLVCFHLGIAVGPLATETVQAALSYDAAWLALGGLAASGALVALLLPRQPRPEALQPAPWIHPRGLLPGVVLAFGNVGFVAFNVFVPLYARELGLSRVGLVFAVGSVSIAGARLLLGRAPDRLGPVRAGTLALAVTVGGSLVAALWQQPAGVFVAAAVLAVGMALQTPSLIPVAVDGVKPSERPAALATFTMFMDLSWAMSGPVVGILVSRVGYRAGFASTVVTSAVALVLLHVWLAPHWRASRAATRA